MKDSEELIAVDKLLTKFCFGLKNVRIASSFSVVQINLNFMLKPCDFFHVLLICSLQNYKSPMFDM